MTLLARDYIERSKIRDTTIRYRWDDWDVEQAEQPVSKKLAKQLKKLSERANIAFAVATTEWIVYRLEWVLDDPMPFDYLEAAWAQIVDFRYSFVWWDPLHDHEWTGPVKGPIREAIAWVMEIIRVVEEDREHPARMCASLSRLAEYVMTDAAPYRAWRDRVIKRLEQYYPLDRSEPLGDVVPREALDPDFAFRPNQTEALVNQFLSRLNPKDHEFLNSHDDLLKEGFEGTPYVFNIEADRRLRSES
jgi:hypothetical protein